MYLDSNCFHAVCMDTQPPLFYLNDSSKQIISLVNEFNSKFGHHQQQKHVVAYTFDAGPNAFLFVEDNSLLDLIYVIYRVYFEVDEAAFVRECLVANESKLSVDFSRIDQQQRKQQLDEFCIQWQRSSVRAKKLIHSKVGDEPLVYDSDMFSLLVKRT